MCWNLLKTFHLMTSPWTPTLKFLVPGSAFIKWDQLNPWIKDQLGKALLSTIWPLQLPNFVSCGRDKCETVDRRVIFIRSLIHGSSWSGLIKAEPGITLWWRHNGRDVISNDQPHHCLPNCLFGHRSKKTSKLRVTGFGAGNSPGTGEFPAQMASNAENVSIWWRHEGACLF